ncbi:MAG: hypothetical protein ACT4PU_06350 [Planctomycetota bacterium]
MPPPGSSPDSRRVDLVNIGLMLGSCALAFALPFDLFLFSYAVLGPLHYLTEISWLHQRGYFVPRRFDLLWLLLPLGALLALEWGLVGLDMARTVPLLNAAGLGVAVALVATSAPRRRLLIVAAACGLGWALTAQVGTPSSTPPGTLSVAHDVLRVFLPTLIHVWLFTAAFVLLGALRGRSFTGAASFTVFLACSAACFLIRPRGGTLDVPPAYDSILGVNLTLFDWFGTAAGGRAELLFSPLGRAIARFVAFAYTYHYLNWFSKTSIIQWHKIPRAWTYTNLALWAASVALYAYDFQLGLAALFALSYLHVYLELPLNQRSFAGIARELATFTRRPAAP